MNEPVTRNEMDAALGGFAKRCVIGTVIFCVSLLLLVLALTGIKSAREYHAKHGARHGEVEGLLRKHASDTKVLVNAVNRNQKDVAQLKQAVKILTEHRAYGRSPTAAPRK